MIQEKNDLILGLQLDAACAQLTYYNSSMKEPVTVSADGESETYLIPMEQAAWEQANSPQGSMDKLTAFISRCLDLVSGLGKPEDMRIMVCVRSMDETIGQRIPKALEQIGVERKYIFLQDYKSSFYYYTINQKKELWSSDVALVECVDETMIGYVLHINKSTRPSLVTVEEAARQPVNEKVRDGREGEDWDRERDRLFFELLKKVFERRNVTTTYLLGDYFDKTWARRSFSICAITVMLFRGKTCLPRAPATGLWNGWACLERRICCLWGRTWSMRIWACICGSGERRPIIL